jgi:hypothetical protein
MTFSFLPADIVSQILNFGAPAPIDLQVRGNDLGADYAYANKLLRRFATSGRRRCAHPAVGRAADDRCRHRPHARAIHRRDRADVTNSLVVNLAGSSQVAPTYWLNRRTA